MASDHLSAMHFRAVRAEIEGRFFSDEEAAELKQAIKDRIIIDPEMRAMAAKTWPAEGSDAEQG